MSTRCSSTSRPLWRLGLAGLVLAGAGLRVWVVLTHAQSVLREREDLLGYLESIGVCRQELHVPLRTIGYQYSAAETILYDLDEAGRGESTSTPSTFPIAGPLGGSERLRCGEGPASMVPPTAKRRAVETPATK